MNSKADSTRAVAHRWNLGATAAPRTVARAAAPASPHAAERNRLRLRLAVSIDDAGPAQVPAAAFELLRRMPRVDSLREAASGFGYSYRHAWELIRRAERALGNPLIATRRGRGTQLTPYGELLAAALEEIEARLSSELDAATRALSAALAMGQPGAAAEAPATPPAARPARAHKRTVA